MPICWILSQLERVRRVFFGQPCVAQPKRILIVLLSEMGSLVLAQPMFADLRKRYPDASLHILMFAKNREVLDLLGVMPPENVITIRDKSLGGFVADTLRAILTMRRVGFDVVIDCELFSRVSAIFLTCPVPQFTWDFSRTRRKVSTVARSSTVRCCTTPIAICRSSS